MAVKNQQELIPERLREPVGKERDLDSVSQILESYAGAIGAPVVGAFQISCSDESERECVESFHNIFVRKLLPELEYSSRSSFRTANLGSRYEKGAIAIAEEHFATPASSSSFKLLVVKINSHVSVVDTDDGPRYGRMQRYDRELVYCGAMHALLDGGSLPFLAELDEMFGSDGIDRLTALRAMAPETRGLLTAITSVQLQAGRIVADIATVEQHSPTLYLVVAGVTVNRREPDSELVCSIHAIDHRGQVPVMEHISVGDEPARYRLEHEGGKLLVGNH